MEIDTLMGICLFIITIGVLIVITTLMLTGLLNPYRDCNKQNYTGYVMMGTKNISCPELLAINTSTALEPIWKKKI